MHKISWPAVNPLHRTKHESLWVFDWFQSLSSTNSALVSTPISSKSGVPQLNAEHSGPHLLGIEVLDICRVLCYNALWQWEVERVWDESKHAWSFSVMLGLSDRENWTNSIAGWSHLAYGLERVQRKRRGGGGFTVCVFAHASTIILWHREVIVVLYQQLNRDGLSWTLFINSMFCFGLLMFELGVMADWLP